VENIVEERDNKKEGLIRIYKKNNNNKKKIN